MAVQKNATTAFVMPCSLPSDEALLNFVRCGRQATRQSAHSAIGSVRRVRYRYPYTPSSAVTAALPPAPCMRATALCGGGTRATSSRMNRTDLIASPSSSAIRSASRSTVAGERRADEGDEGAGDTADDDGDDGEAGRASSGARATGTDRLVS
jgi:hypothetical protein